MFPVEGVNERDPYRSLGRYSTAKRASRRCGDALFMLFEISLFDIYSAAASGSAAGVSSACASSVCAATAEAFFSATFLAISSFTFFYASRRAF